MGGFLRLMVLIFLLPHLFDLRVGATKTEIFDAPNVRIEIIDHQASNFYVSKSHDLRLRCSIRLPSSVRLSENTRQILWKFNEVDVTTAGLPSGAVQLDGERLTLKANPDAELLVGKYSCNVTWPTYGSVLSPPVHVQLAAMKKFKTDTPVEERIVIGHTAYLPCHVPESHPGPAKIWFTFNGSKEIIFSHGRYFLTPTGLQIAHVEKSDRGAYVCRAMNPISGQARDSKPIELTILEEEKSIVEETRPSAHFQQRNKLEVRRGDNVTLECVMTTGLGRTTSQVRWEKYGSVLPPIERRKQILGNLVLYNLTKEDEGSYICRGPSESTAAEKRHQAASNHPPRFIMYSLRVYDVLRAKLTIERDLEEDDKSATSGLAYRLTCQASSGQASELEFWVNGQPLLSTQLKPLRTKFQSAESPIWSFTLTESTLRKGVYQCMVRGREPFDKLTLDSDNLYVDSRFVATTTTRRGELDNEDWTSASGMDEPTRVTQSMDLDQPSMGGSSRSIPPKIIIGPENETTTVGSSVTFVCQVSRNTDVVYWLKDGERIFDYDPNDDEDDDENQEEQSSKRYKRIGTGSLNIETTVEQDRGWYTCVATNSNGNSTAKAFLDFDRQPIPTINEERQTSSRSQTPTNSVDDEDDNSEEPPPSTKGGNQKNMKKKKIRLDQPNIFRYSNTSVYLVWRMTPEQRRANSGVRFFKLQYKKLTKSDGEKTLTWRTLDQELPSHSYSGTIDGLEPGQKYKFRYAVVYDNNDQALSKMTSPYDMAIEKKQDGPKLPPTLTKVQALSWSAISLVWTYPNDQERASVDGYTIMYRRIYYADTSVIWQNDTVIGGPTREHVLPYLLPATLYQIKMVAFNTVGRSRESNVVEEMTLSTDGTKPPRTFDAAAPPVRSSSVLARNQPTIRANIDGNLDVTQIGNDVSWPPAYANRTDKSAGILTWLNIKSETLLYIIGGVLGALFLLLVIFMVVCTVRQRQQKKLVNAAQGKYRDASKKIYREQALCNERSVMKEMYPPISNSTSFQHSTGDSNEDEHDECPPPPALSQSTSGLIRDRSIPPPPSMTAFSNGSLRPGAGIIMNLYANPLDFEDGEDDRKLERRMGLLNRTTTEFGDGEEIDELLSAEERLMADNYLPKCDLNKNDVRYGIRGVGNLSNTASINGRHHRPIPPPLILTSASALTSGGPTFAGGFNQSFFSSSSPHASLASNYSSSNAGDIQSTSTNGNNNSNHTPLLPPPLFSHNVLNDDLLLDTSTTNEEKRKRIPTPVPNFPHSQNLPAGTLASLKSDTSSSRTEKRRQPSSRMDDRNGHHHQQTNGNGNLLNGAASPMSVSSHASIGSGSATSANGSSRPNFSTFRPDPNNKQQEQNRHHNRNLLLYRNRLSDGYCSDA